MIVLFIGLIISYYSPSRVIITQADLKYLEENISGSLLKQLGEKLDKVIQETTNTTDISSLKSLQMSVSELKDALINHLNEEELRLKREIEAKEKHCNDMMTSWIDQKKTLRSECDAQLEEEKRRCSSRPEQKKLEACGLTLINRLGCKDSIYWPENLRSLCPSI